MVKKVLIGLGAVLVIIQFFGPTQHIVKWDNPNDIKTKYSIPRNVQNYLTVACNDCHSNKTLYPWYAKIQPIGWWLNKHVTDGKRHLNLSEFTSRPLAYQNHKLEEIIEQVKEKEMPLPSYTLLGLHSSANLSDKQRDAIITWAQSKMDSLKANVPVDSLIMRRRTPPPAQ